jgi:hypothetical protein
VEDNIKMDFSERRWGIMTDLTQDGDQWRALVKTIMKLQGLQNVRIFLSN